MAKKGIPTPRPVIGDPLDPDNLYHFMLRFLNWGQEKNYSPQTLHGQEKNLRYFIQWCEDRNLSHPTSITKPILERYQRYLFYYRKSNGDPLSFHSQRIRITPIRAYFKWLARQNYILYNPASELDPPRQEHHLPKVVLTSTEAEAIINQTNSQQPVGIRDRAILETFYSTGMRRQEIINLNINDIDFERGIVIIRQSKNNKDRVIPIGERALHWIKKYRQEVRPELLTIHTETTLFLTTMGEYFTPRRMSQLVTHYVNQANIEKRGSCHLFRHTMATLMLENGADIRYIQSMLGHAHLSTTQIYTQVSISKLKAVHAATHPAKMSVRTGDQ